jgi:metalloendopeptidase OMA1, mitochondrial
MSRQTSIFRTLKYRYAVPILAIVLAGALSGCATVAETGRSQLMLVSDQEVTHLSLSEFDKMKGEKPVSQDQELTAQVRKVGQRIARVANLPGAQWEFILFDDPKVPNAFCMPGGKVGVYSGILPITRSEAGLATVMAHEVAHAVARHGAERISEGLLMKFGGAVLSTALMTQGVATQQLAMAAFGVGGQLGYTLPHSRSQESEADYIGLLYMARAGYDPREAVAFWQRFAAYNTQHGGKQSEFLSTHPLDETRIAQLQKWVPEAQAEFGKAPP